jgi:hypothetical protein
MAQGSGPPTALQANPDINRAALIELRPIVNSTHIVVARAPYDDDGVAHGNDGDVAGRKADDSPSGRHHHGPRRRHDDDGAWRRDHDR